jgi:hypothetical protein
MLVPTHTPHQKLKTCNAILCFVDHPLQAEQERLGHKQVYHHIRLKYEDALFTDFGGVSRVSRVMKTPGKVNAFIMEQEPRKVAAFVWECMEYRQFEAPDLLPYWLARRASYSDAYTSRAAVEVSATEVQVAKAFEAGKQTLRAIFEHF